MKRFDINDLFVVSMEHLLSVNAEAARAYGTPTSRVHHAALSHASKLNLKPLKSYLPQTPSPLFEQTVSAPPTVKLTRKAKQKRKHLSRAEKFDLASDIAAGGRTGELAVKFGVSPSFVSNMRKHVTDRPVNGLKIDSYKATAIKERLAAGEPVEAIAKRYDISPRTVSKIRDGEIWVNA